MSWITQGTSRTDPAYYRDAADATEAQLRADFASYHQLRGLAPYCELPAHTVEYRARAYALARGWNTDAASVEHRHLWQQLEDAVAAWQDNSEAARVALGRLDHPTAQGDQQADPVTVRTLRQAAELTGHLEPVTTRTDLDSARWRPRHLRIVRETDTSASRSAADRALGGRAPELSMVQVAAIIEATDELLDVEEHAGDLDTGVDERAALIPGQHRDAPITYDYSTDLAAQQRQIRAVAQLQDLTAQHLALAEQFDRGVGGPEMIDRLETLLSASRDARREAARAGVPDAEITAACQTGLDGHFWSRQPGVARLGQLAQVLQQRDAALNELASTKSPGLQPRTAWAEPVISAADYVDADTTPGAVISDAIDAAVLASDPGPDPDLDLGPVDAEADVIAMPARDASFDPQI